MTAARKYLKAAVSLMLAVLLALTFAVFPSQASALGLNATSLTITKGYA